ncbi:MAG: YicC/YloC family endoribonuclease [Beijerinckiaceae bacterium]
MTLSSMTGFARTAGHEDAASWSWELRSVNAKGLDLRVRLPAQTAEIETEVRRMLGAVVVRGTVNVSLDIVRHGTASDVRINHELAASLLRQLGALAKQEGLPAPGLDSIIAIRGVVETTEEHAALPVAVHKGLIATLEDAVVQLIGARQQEGAALLGILQSKLADMADKVDAADVLPSRGADAVRDRLARQVRDLIGDGSIALDPQRLHQEAVLLAVKSDVREEIDRLKAHVAQGRELLTRGGPIGRRLDFLSQELSREVNTLCAKANDVALTDIGLDLKGLVEQFREQVQNVE